MIHQIWMEGEQHLKEKEDNLYQNVLKMREIHGADNHKLWSKQMIQELIQTEYPHLVSTYNFYPHFVMKLHFAKYIILHHFGGFYVDIDCKPKRNLYELIKFKDCYHSQLPLVVKDIDEHCCKIKSNKKFINNHFIYIPYRHHPLINILLESAPKESKRKPFECHLTWIMRSVGPYFLTKCIKKYKIMTQKELKKAKHKSTIHDILSQHKSQNTLLSPKQFSWSHLSKSMSISQNEIKSKVHTEDIVNLINVNRLDFYLNHNQHNLWLNDKWVKELKIVNRVKLSGAQIAVVVVCVGALVVAL